ncbi:YfjD family protein [Paenibacillus sp. N1-5-1-14]|uniref:YfjD family protein n=1 Tax=Paenibacillus radicibacter TaxID=2972488 RepID=UPI00215966D7|nr:YfjD family protein [Paenibacillus radicibacter]MCR8643655.1 YfjD family protein [Paenibacillus radicibacter]
MKNLKETARGVQVSFTNFVAIRFLIAMVIMILTSGLVFILIPEVDESRRLYGVVVGLIGLVFSSWVLLTIISVISKGRVLLEIEDGYLINRKHRVALQEIAHVQFGWHSKKKSGMVFKDLIITTVRNEEYYFRYYNLLSGQAIATFIEQYMIPHAAADYRKSWDSNSKGVSKKLI